MNAKRQTIGEYVFPRDARDRDWLAGYSAFDRNPRTRALYDDFFAFRLAALDYEAWLERDIPRDPKSNAWDAGRWGGGLLRGAEQTGKWSEETRVFYDALSQVEGAVRQCERRRCSVPDAAAIIRAATEDLRSAMPSKPDYLAHAVVIRRGNLTNERLRRLESMSGDFQISATMLAAISHAHERHRWHVALHLLLSAAIHVVQKNRPSAFDVVAKARELAGGVFPGGSVDLDLSRLAGARIDRLTDKPRGGRGKRSVGVVVEALRRKYEPSDEDLVFEVIRTNPGINGDEPIAALLAPMRRQRVTVARRALINEGRIENRGTDRRPRLFVPNGSSSDTPKG